LVNAREDMTASLNRTLSIGSQKNTRKAPTMAVSGFRMVFHSIRLGSDDRMSSGLLSARLIGRFSVEQAQVVFILPPNQP
jgi:hypothetical protein